MGGGREGGQGECSKTAFSFSWNPSQSMTPVWKNCRIKMTKGLRSLRAYMPCSGSRVCERQRHSLNSDLSGSMSTTERPLIQVRIVEERPSTRAPGCGRSDVKVRVPGRSIRLGMLLKA